MVNYSRPGVTGKQIEATCNVRALQGYIRNARFREDQTGELPTRGEIEYYFRLARYEPPPAFAEEHPRLLAHLHRWNTTLNGEQK